MTTSVPQSPGPIRGLAARITTYGRMIKFSHTVFALPFVLSAVVLAFRDHAPGIREIFWILAAAVSARSAAMGFNRIADLNFDRQNPRTQTREIPSGKLSLAAAAGFVAVFSAAFILSAAMLSALCFYLSFPALAVLFGYSYTKRFTRWCHLYLGFAISMAPMGAWIAATGTFSWGIAVLSLALMTYIAGFDIIYSCQDTDFDREQHLFSLPSALGVEKALKLSALLHFLSLSCFLAIYGMLDMGWIYLGTVGVIGVLFLVEHLLVNPKDLRHIDIAFFHVNSGVSVVLFLGILLDEGMGRWI